MLGKTTINAGKRNKLGMINILNYHIHPTPNAYFVTKHPQYGYFSLPAHAFGL